MTRRDFALAAGALVAGRGVFGQPPGTFVVWVHGMTILDISGNWLVIHMPAVMMDDTKHKKSKAPAKTTRKQMPPCAANFAHTYCLTEDSTLATGVPLLSDTCSRAEYMMRIKTAGTKPAPDPTTNFYLKRTSANDLIIDPAKIVVAITLPFPKSVLPLRYAYNQDGTPVIAGPTCDSHNEHPTKVPLLYGLVYELTSGENPSLVGSDGRMFWQKSGADHVHVHAQPAGPGMGDHIQALTHAFNPPADFGIRTPKLVADCAPANGALGTPASELYGLPGINAAPCKPGFRGKKIDPDPGNCVDMFLDS